MDGGRDEGLVGWMDGWVGGWMDGRTMRQNNGKGKSGRDLETRIIATEDGWGV